MSTPNPPAGHAPVPAAPKSAPPQQERQILVVSHCGLFYWWPVWAVGFVMWLVTALPHLLPFIGGADFMVTVPNHTSAIKKAYTDEKGKVRDAYVLPDGKTLPLDNDQPRQPYVWMSPNKNLGIVFVAVLLMVTVITNIPLRGLWSVIALVIFISVVIIFALLEVWEAILHYLSFLDIRINAAGYLVISSVLFALWLLVMLLFDRQIYMVFTPGQLRVRQEIGDAETAFDVTGMTIQKQRSDLFRHWILGLGSGDLIVKTAGANSQEFHMPNVLFIGRKVRDIEEMLRQRQMVSGKN